MRSDFSKLAVWGAAVSMLCVLVLLAAFALRAAGFAKDQIPLPGDSVAARGNVAIQPGFKGVSQPSTSDHPAWQVATAPAAVASQAPTAQPPRATTTPQESTPIATDLHQHDFGSWRYQAGRLDSEVKGTVYYDYSSVAALKAYAAANKDLANQMGNSTRDLEVNVTFRTYLDPVQFRNWVASMGLQVEESYLRVVDGGGKGGTMGLGSRPGDPLPQSDLDQMLKPVQEEHGPATLMGIYYTTGTIPARKLSQLENDRQVFLADVTVNVVRDELASMGWEGVAQPRNIQVIPPTPFWKMEELGLSNFAP